MANTVSKKNKVKRTAIEKANAKLEAHLAGKKVWVTVPNSDPKNTKERFVRVLGVHHWGDPKKKKKSDSPDRRKSA